jgi:ABC-type nitrate/sulfonate/bicarbonate transport system ATPase subunit
MTTVMPGSAISNGLTPDDLRSGQGVNKVVSADEVVAIQDISKHFVVEEKSVPVLDHVSLSVAKGSTVSIVGPSGCGKTTLLRMVQGLETISSGAITTLGQSPSSTEIDAGFVFQQPSLFPWFTVQRNIEFGLRLRARRGRVTAAQGKQRVRELLELVGLTDFATYRPHQLSGGMQQRVNLARALAIDPAVLLLDEPFSAVDTLTRERLQLVLERSLAELGTTAIIVTHDIREAVFLGNKVAVMGNRPGQILTEIPVDTRRPRNQEFQHGSELAVISQEIYAHLQLGEEANADP